MHCPANGEHVQITHRPDEDAEHAEILVTLGEIGSGPGVHLHPHQVESFQVVRGRVEVRVGDEYRSIGVGEQVAVPPGTAHRYRALESGTQLRITITPGHGFETALADVYDLLDRGVIGPDGITDRAAFDACFERHKDIMVSLRER